MAERSGVVVVMEATSLVCTKDQNSFLFFYLEPPPKNFPPKFPNKKKTKKIGRGVAKALKERRGRAGPGPATVTGSARKNTTGWNIREGFRER